MADRKGQESNFRLCKQNLCTTKSQRKQETFRGSSREKRPKIFEEDKRRLSNYTETSIGRSVSRHHRRCQWWRNPRSDSKLEFESDCRWRLFVAPAFRQDQPGRRKDRVKEVNFLFRAHSNPDTFWIDLDHFAAKTTGPKFCNSSWPTSKQSRSSPFLSNVLHFFTTHKFLDAIKQSIIPFIPLIPDTA